MALQYVTKDSVELNALLTLVHEARRHIELHGSRAEDARSKPKQRIARHFMQRSINQIEAELADVFAAAIDLNQKADESSEGFVYWDAWDLVRKSKRSVGPALPPSRVADASDEDEEEPPLPPTPTASETLHETYTAGATVDRNATPDALEGSDEAETAEADGATAAAELTDAMQQIGEDPRWTSELDVDAYEGTAEVFNKVPVSVRTHYEYRGALLAPLNPLEYWSMIKVVERRISKPGAPDKRGGQGMPRFRFAPGHPGRRQPLADIKDFGLEPYPSLKSFFAR